MSISRMDEPSASCCRFSFRRVLLLSAFCFGCSYPENLSKNAPKNAARTYKIHRSNALCCKRQNPTVSRVKIRTQVEQPPVLEVLTAQLDARASSRLRAPLSRAPLQLRPACAVRSVPIEHVVGLNRQRLHVTIGDGWCAIRIPVSCSTNTTTVTARSFSARRPLYRSGRLVASSSPSSARPQLSVVASTNDGSRTA
jgi:hypothetical protein